MRLLTLTDLRFEALFLDDLRLETLFLDDLRLLTLTDLRLEPESKPKAPESPKENRSFERLSPRTAESDKPAKLFCTTGSLLLELPRTKVAGASKGR